jgi:hypothetical protein
MKMSWLNPDLAPMVIFRNMIQRQTEKALSLSRNEKTESDKPTTLIHELAHHPALSEQDKKLLRLRDEAFMVIGAGGGESPRTYPTHVLETGTHPCLLASSCLV